VQQEQLLLQEQLNSLDHLHHQVQKEPLLREYKRQGTWLWQDHENSWGPRLGSTEEALRLYCKTCGHAKLLAVNLLGHNEANLQRIKA
jgi:hypothetical protein